jgi:hypothetical protein
MTGDDLQLLIWISLCGMMYAFFKIKDDEDAM